jgi:hypothetical protein
MFPQKVIEILSPKVMALGDRAFRRRPGHMVGALMNRTGALIKEAQDRPFTLSTL